MQRTTAADQAGQQRPPLGAVFRSGKVWLLALVYFLFVMGLYGVSFWLPQLVKNTGVKDVLDVGLLTALPYGVAALAMVLLARHSDRTGERRWHAAGAVGLVVATVYSDNTVLALLALSLATAGILGTFPVFWSLPTAMLGGTAAAAGIALINSVGNLAGFVSPYLIGAIKDASGSTALGIYLLAASLLGGALLVLLGVRPVPAA